MKKYLITLLMVLSLSATAWAGDQNSKLRSLVSSYKGTDGFEVVDLGGIGLSLLKATARASADSDEDRQALALFNGLKHLTIVDFSEAPAGLREQFLRKANGILAGGEMLLEAKDGGETVRIYGTSSADGLLLEDIAILADDALIFIRGHIRTDQIEALMQQAEK